MTADRSDVGEGMDPLRRNYFVDAFMGAVFAVCLISGLAFFPGLVGTLGIRPRDLPVNELRTVHEWAGLIVGAIVLIHVALHRQWIVNITKQMMKREEGEKKG